MLIETTQAGGQNFQNNLFEKVNLLKFDENPGEQELEYRDQSMARQHQQYHR